MIINIIYYKYYIINIGGASFNILLFLKSKVIIVIILILFLNNIL